MNNFLFCLAVRIAHLVLTVLVSRPERSTVPGTAPVTRSSRIVSTPLTRTETIADGLGVEPGAVAGQVVHEGGGPGLDPLGVEEDEVRVAPLLDPPPLRAARTAGRDRR